jgi:hypothetical protein
MVFNDRPTYKDRHARNSSWPGELISIKGRIHLRRLVASLLSFSLAVGRRTIHSWDLSPVRSACPDPSLSRDPGRFHPAAAPDGAPVWLHSLLSCNLLLPSRQFPIPDSELWPVIASNRPRKSFRKLNLRHPVLGVLHPPPEGNSKCASEASTSTFCLRC